MMGKTMGFLTAVVAIPIVSQIPADTAVDRLAIGSAQAILAIVVVSEAVAILLMFKMWRKDVDADRANSKEESKILQELVKTNAEANTKRSESDKQLKESIYHFAEVVKMCERKKQP